MRCELSEYISAKHCLENEIPTMFSHYYSPTKKSLSDFKLSEPAKRIYSEPNAGGSSFNSEALSADLMVHLFDASNVVTEMEIAYCVSNWKKCDYLITILGHQVGVSVTRAMGYPDPTRFNDASAEHLLHKKLFGLISARQGVKKRHRFTKSILHVWCETDIIADCVKRVYDTKIDQSLKDNITVILSISDANRKSASIYYDFLDRSLLSRYQPSKLQ